MKDLKSKIWSFLVFELLEKGEILEIPTEKPLTEDEAWRSFRDVISGLEYCKYILLHLYIFNIFGTFWTFIMCFAIVVQIFWTKHLNLNR